MTTKVFIIGGGVEASNYKNFKDYIEQTEYNPYEEKLKGWKDNLGDDLGNNYEAIKIPMPNKGFANYEYWCLFFQKALPYFGEENILIGHSLGGSFLLKYLSNSNIENISQIHLVTPALFDSEYEKLGSFTPSITPENYKKYENITTAYFSKDDDIVGFENCEHLQNILKNAKYEIFKYMGHFIIQEHFEKLVKNIKNN